VGWSGDSLGFAEVVKSNLMSKANLREREWELHIKDITARAHKCYW